jgi:hypothetical protein
MKIRALVMIAVAGIFLSLPVLAAAQTVVKDFVVIQVDPAWLAGDGRTQAVSSRIGEVITPPKETRFRVGHIDFKGRRKDAGLGEIVFPSRPNSTGTGEIMFTGRSRFAGTGAISFEATPDPGVRGTVRRTGELSFHGPAPEKG